MVTIKLLGYSQLGYVRDEIMQSLKDISENHIIVDIRERPFGLVNRPQLHTELKKRYVWIKQFGNPSYKKRAEEGEKKFKEIYERAEKEEVDIVLMCGCSKVNECHRSSVATILLTMDYKKIETFFGEPWEAESVLDMFY